MKRIILILLLVPLLLPAQNKTCEDCYGDGSVATGGRGKALGIVTTLDENASVTYFPPSGGNDKYYTGGFNTLMQTDSVGYVVFDRSGPIELLRGNGTYSGYRRQYGESGMPNVRGKTVYGQSAPLGGVTFWGGSFAFNYPRNLVMMHLRSRHIYNKNNTINTSDDANSWALLFRAGDSIYIRNFSASFSQDKNMGGYLNEFDVPGEVLQNITIDYALVADGNTNMYFEINNGRPGSPEDYVDKISVYRSLIGSSNRTPNLSYNGRANKINNVITDMRVYGTNTSHDIRLNDMYNWHSSFNGTYGLNTIDPGFDTQIYSYGNVGEFVRAGTGNLDESDDQKKFWANDPGFVTPASSSDFVSTMFGGTVNPLPMVSAEAARTNVLVNKKAGANLYMSEDGYLTTYIDPFDDAYMDDMIAKVNYDEQNASNWVLPSTPSNVHGPSYDTDHDGMADLWEERYFGDNDGVVEAGELDQSYRGDFNGDGYENIEHFMMGTDPTEGSAAVPVTGIFWEDDDQIQYLSGTLNMNYYFTPENPTNQGVTQSSNAVFSVVSDFGSIIGVGTAEITITTDDGGYQDVMTVEIVPDPPVANPEKMNRGKFHLIYN